MCTRSKLFHANVRMRNKKTKMMELDFPEGLLKAVSYMASFDFVEEQVQHVIVFLSLIWIAQRTIII